MVFLQTDWLKRRGTGFLLLLLLVTTGCEGIPTVTVEPNAGDTTWQRTANHLRGQNGTIHVIQCSAAGTAQTVWGTEVYTDDSSICTAGVHAGKINRVKGGVVTIEIRPGQDSYLGSQRNGVSTSDYGSWPGSFIFR